MNLWKSSSTTFLMWIYKGAVMKNMLLVIFMLMSFNTFAEEEIWFCTPEYNAGLYYDESAKSWINLSFTIDRETVKQTGTKLEFAEDGLFQSLNLSNKCYETLAIDETIISCSSSTQMFNLNPIFGVATSSNIFGPLNSKFKDTPVVIIWKCESF